MLKVSTIRLKTLTANYDYKCSLNSDLKKHEKQVHTKIKDVECKLCEFACSHYCDLKTHVKQVHTKIKDVKCKLCDYACRKMLLWKGISN